MPIFPVSREQSSQNNAFLNQKFEKNVKIFALLLRLWIIFANEHTENNNYFTRKMILTMKSVATAMVPLTSRSNNER